MNRIIFFGAILVCTFFAFANPAPRKVLPPTSDQELTSAEEPLVSTEEPSVYVRSLEVMIRANELTATTTLEMEIFNQGNRIMDGTVEFSLAEGQVITGFKLDIGKNMREGVIVEKKKARKTYETIVNRKVDPGLLEVTAGNNYRLRVYPVPAQGSRKVSIIIDQEIKIFGNEAVYSLPILFSKVIENYSLQIETENARNQPVVKNGFLENLSFDGNRLLYEQESVMLNSPHSFAIPINREETKICVDSRNYFSARIPFVIPEKDDIRASSLSVFWDISSSAKNRDVNKELDFLQAYLEKFHFRKLRIIGFNNEIQETREYDDPHSKITVIKNFLQSLNFDGATNLEILNDASLMLQQNMLFSDGINNFGKNNFVLSNPLHTILSSNVSDPYLLKYLASSSGGHFVELGAGNVTELVHGMLIPARQYVKAKGEKVSDLIAKYYDGFIQVSGRLEEEEGKVEMEIGSGRNPKKMQAGISVISNCGDDLSMRGWRAAKMSMESVVNFNGEEKIRTAGNNLGIVTEFTSLIVLETLEDYIQFDILPPAELMDDFNKNVMVQNRKKKADPEPVKNEKVSMDIINDLVSENETRNSWWKTRFPLRPQKNNSVARGNVISSLDSTSFGFAQSETRSANVITMEAPPALRMPMPASEGKRGEELKMEEVVVTALGTQRRSQNLANSATTMQVQVADLSVDNFAAGFSDITVVPKESRVRDEKIKETIKNERIDKVMSRRQLLLLNKADLYVSYLTMKKSSEGNDASFYLEVAGRLHVLGSNTEAKRVLSNLAELELEDHQLLRAMAYVFETWKDYRSAIFLYEKILKLRDDEPQSYRDLALAKNANGEHQEAIDLLYKALTSNLENSNSRFDGILAIMLNELNAIIEKHGSELKLDKIDKSILSSMPVDLRIVVDWNKDQTDIDMHIVEPGNEECYYEHPESRNGGLLSEDMTEGYGPEEYSIRKALKGRYKVRINYYGDNYQKEQVPSFIKVTIYKNFGRANETVEIKNMFMKGRQGMIDVAEVIFE